MSEQTNIRALTVGEILDRAFRIYRTGFVMLLGVVAVMMIPQGVLRFISILYLRDTRFVDITLSGIFQNLAVVGLVVAISNLNLGKDITINSAYSQGVKRFWSVIGSNFMVGLAIALPAFVIGICFGLTGLGWLAIILILPIAMFASTRWSLNTSAIVLENIGALAGLTRSWALTKDHFWRVFATSFAATLLSLLLTILPSLLTSYFLGLMDVSLRLIELTNLVMEQISLIFALPFTIAVQVLIYYDLRIRDEGLDLIMRTEEMHNLPLHEN